MIKYTAKGKYMYEQRSGRNCDIILFRPWYCPIRVKSVYALFASVRDGDGAGGDGEYVLSLRCARLHQIPQPSIPLKIEMRAAMQYHYLSYNTVHRTHCAIHI